MTIPDSYSVQTNEATLDNVQCSGSESQLTDCIHGVGVPYRDLVPRVECEYCKYASSESVQGHCVLASET